MQVPLRKANINGDGIRNEVGVAGGGTRGIPPMPNEQTKLTGMGNNANAITGMNSTYPHHQHLMTTMIRSNGSEGFATTAEPGGNNNYKELSVLTYSPTKRLSHFLSYYDAKIVCI